MALSLKPEHLRRYKDMALLLMKYGRADLVRSAGLEEAIEGAQPSVEVSPAKMEELAADVEQMGPTFIKLAQLLSTRADLLPQPYIEALTRLQDEVEPFPFTEVEQIVASELGVRISKAFSYFEAKPIAAASLGQVHRATDLEGRPLACKLQYPDMASAVEADLRQLQVLFAIHRRMDPAIDTSEIAAEIGARVREELDYEREARHMALYGGIFRDDPAIRVPRVRPELSTRRLLTMDWLEGRRILLYRDRDLDTRNRLAVAMFRAWWLPFSRYGVIHGDPHLGNYTVFAEEGEAGNGSAPGGIDLLDYGCIRIFAPRFVQGVIDLYHGLLRGERDKVVSAYETWGFKGLSDELIDVLNIWARFIYGPLIDDRERTIADGVSPAEYGRREAFRVHRALKEKGPVTVPREFVFMDRAAIGLGAVFLHLDARLNFHRLFEETVADFELARLAARQARALEAAGLEVPEPG